MSKEWNHHHWARRDVLKALSATSAATLLGLHAEIASAEPPPETPTIRIHDSPIACFAPSYVAAELLRLEGFTDVQYVKTPLNEGPTEALLQGRVDFIMDDPPAYLLGIEAGAKVTILGGVHTGCWELFGSDSVRTLHDLKGKTIAAPQQSSREAFVAAMVASVGLNPNTDIVWVDHEPHKSMELFAEGKLDAFMGFAPEPQELRDRGIGHVIINTLTDRPWSQYFCCLSAMNTDYAQNYPVATKRALRALFKAAEICLNSPELAAEVVVKAGVSDQYDYVLQAVREIGYRNWHIYDSEDTMRFWALRLREAGLIESSPKKIISEHCDWRYVNELKRELKA